MVTLDDILVEHIETKIEQDNLVPRLLSLCDENLISEIKEIGSNIALNVAAEMQGTNPFNLCMQIQETKIQPGTTMKICDRIASTEVAMIVMEHLRS